MDAKATFLRSLYAEQLAFFNGREFDPRLDQLLQNELTAKQIFLFRQWKDEEASLNYGNPNESTTLRRMEHLLEKFTSRLDKMEAKNGNLMAEAKWGSFSKPVQHTGFDILFEKAMARLEKLEENHQASRYRCSPNDSLVNKRDNVETLLERLATKQRSIDQIKTEVVVQDGTAMKAVLDKLTKFETLFEKITDRLEKLEENPSFAIGKDIEQESLVDSLRLLNEKINKLESNQTVVANDEKCMKTVLDKLAELDSLMNKFTERIVRLEEKPTSTAGNNIEQDTLVASLNVLKNKMNMLESKQTASLPTNKGGVIFCAGGEDSEDKASRAVQVYDSADNKWVPMGEMKDARFSLGLVEADGELYAIGGYAEGVYLSSAEVFTPRTGTWQCITKMNIPACSIGVAHMCGAIYAIGGYDEDNCFDKAEKYDITLDRWTQMPNMIGRRSGLGCAVLDNFLYAVGGYDGHNFLNSCERYNPNLSRWEKVASMSRKRSRMGVCVLDGFMYAVGGKSDDEEVDGKSSDLKSVERYDNKTNTWTQVADLNVRRGRVTVAVMDGQLYAMGGLLKDKCLKSVEVYSPSVDKWSYVADRNDAYSGGGAAWLDCSMDVLLASLREKEESED